MKTNFSRKFRTILPQSMQFHAWSRTGRCRIRMEIDSKPESMGKLDRRLIQLKIEREAMKNETDAASKKRLETLQEGRVGRAALLQRAADRSFNCITVDGDTSTNDSFVIVASGASACRYSCRSPGWRGRPRRSRPGAARRRE